MPDPRLPLNLKGLELFQIFALKGSLQATAEATGLSISTVSHRLRGLEEELGVALFDHTRKPLVLTDRGMKFLRSIEDPLLKIRMAKAEVTAVDADAAGFLRIGTIADFEVDITPDLAVHLSEQMPKCDFLYQIATSRDLLTRLQNRALDLGITTSLEAADKGLRDLPLLRDPFVIVLPAHATATLTEVIEGRAKLPFLQFSRHLIIARQIEAQLSRLGMSLPHKFECDSNHTLMAMIAGGAGWTITTPLLLSRARRFQPALSVHPFPGKKFSRTLSIVATPDCASGVVDRVNARVRQVLTDQVITPMCAQIPWLDGAFTLID